MNKILLLIRSENTEEENGYYIKAIEQFGGEVVLAFDGESQEKILRKLEEVTGILLPGGLEVGFHDFFLIEYALKHNLKLLGICQGMQSMALYQTANQLVSIENFNHQQKEGYVHEVSLFSGKVKDIFENSKIMVNSHHLQTVLSGGMFSVVGRSSDGLIEAIEGYSKIFQVGVQWHPERMLDYDSGSNRLFLAFIQNKNTD